MENQKKLIVFAQGTNRRYLAGGITKTKNIESFLNNLDVAEDTELNLTNTRQFFRDFRENKDGPYKETSTEEVIGIKYKLIDFICGIEGTEDLIYAPEILSNPEELSIKFGLLPLVYGLVGELKVPSGYAKHTKEEKIDLLAARLKSKRFIPVYNPRQVFNPNKPLRSIDEFTNLFKGTELEGEEIPKILLNRTANTVLSKAFWVPYEDR